MRAAAEPAQPLRWRRRRSALDQLQDAWQRTVLPAVQSRSIPVASLLGEARPATLEGEMLTLEFPASADFHRRQAEEPKNVSVDPRGALRGHGPPARRHAGARRGEDAVEEEDDALTEEALISMLKDTFDATEVEDTPMSKLDMNKLMQQAQQMQAQMQQVQEEVANEVVEASAGGGMVTVKATGGGEIVGITIDPKAIDPDDPEMLADLVLAAVNEALRSANALMESKMQGMLPGGLGGLGLPGL